MLNLGLGIIGLVPFFILTSIVSATEYTNFETGFLKGSSIMTKMLTVYSRGYGDREYHAASFCFRQSIAEQIADGLDQGAKDIADPRLKLSLNQMAKDLRVAEGSYGDIDYWIESGVQQRNRLQRASDRHQELTSLILKTKELEPGEELGYLRGLQIGLNAVINKAKRRGDIEYHMRMFDLQRDVANAAANEIARGAAGLRTPWLRFVVEQLVLDIRALPQKGHGDIDYWADAMRPQQSMVLGRVRDELNGLVDLVTRAALPCEAAMTEAAEGHHFDLKDI